MRIRQHIGNVDIKIDTSRIDKNIREAQKLLNLAVVGDCDPLIPFQQGALRNSVNYPQGYTAARLSITSWYSPPKKHPTGRQLQYHTAGTSDHWFSKAKEAHKDEWVRLVKQTAGKD